MNSNDNTHDPLVECALVGFDLAAEHHIAECQPCQAERDQVEVALRQFAAANREYAKRPEDFWELQAGRIRAARAESDSKSRLTMTLVPSVVVLLLAAFAILGRAPGVRPIQPTAPVAQGDSDHELLLEVERAIQSDTPRALEPATLMVNESDGNLPLDPALQNKETRSHEN
jgi:hypothetical protein